MKAILESTNARTNACRAVCAATCAGTAATMLGVLALFCRAVFWGA